MSHIFLVVWLVGLEARIVPAKSVNEVCALKRRHPEATTFKVTAYYLGRFFGGDAHMMAVAVECQEAKEAKRDE